MPRGREMGGKGGFYVYSGPERSLLYPPAGGSDMATTLRESDRNPRARLSARGASVHVTADGCRAAVLDFAAGAALGDDAPPSHLAIFPPSGC